MKGLTYKQAILKHLRNNPDEWFPSYSLEKVSLCDVWIGNSGGRRARELAEQGLIERKEKSPYVYYRAKPPKSTEVYSVRGQVVYTKKLY